MFCPSCHQHIRDHSLYCNQCGVPLTSGNIPANTQHVSLTQSVEISSSDSAGPGGKGWQSTTATIPAVSLTPPVTPQKSGAIVGEVRGFQQRSEAGVGFSGINLRSPQTIWSFRIERYDGSGNRLPPVAVEMRGSSFEGFISESDQVEANGDLKQGILRLKRIHNITTNAFVVAKNHQARTIALSSISLLVLFISVLFFVSRFIPIPGIQVGNGSPNHGSSTTPTSAAITMNEYCNAIKKADYSTAYNDLSPSYQVTLQRREDQFASQMAARGGTSDCNGVSVQQHGASAQGQMTYTIRGVGGKGNETVIVQLAEENGVWKITSLDEESPGSLLYNFCDGVINKRLADTYNNDYSDTLKTQVTLDAFTQQWSPSDQLFTNCRYTILAITNASATATITATYQEVSASGFTNSYQNYNITLTQDSNGKWKIDSLQGA